jgi:hypothetical protein
VAKHERECIESKAFPGQFVRIRGRVSREYQVQWSPGLRTEKGPVFNRREAAVGRQDQYAVDFLDYGGAVLESGLTEPYFFAKEQNTAAFVARLLYHDQTQTVRLRRGERELGRRSVPTGRPCFTLLHPGEDACINGSGVLHLQWCPHDSEHPMTFFVRYSHNERDWLRPGVNLPGNEYYLDLREMPGGKRCVVQVLATNGYRTSYVQTRYFEVPVKPPDLLLGETTGPVLFAQGFSREEGPITGENVVWLIDDGSITRRGGSLDVRTLDAGVPLDAGVHRVSVSVSDQTGRQTTNLVGSYDSTTGLRVVGPSPL